jgi:formimidoylglutamate deiminase
MRLSARRALLPDGWADNVTVEIDAGGAIEAVTKESEAGAELVAGSLVPGLPNLHSHAFQRAMAGLTERRLHPTDSFWTWRDLMYRFAQKITPEQLEAVATLLFVEMLKSGFTSVAEFHYLHHDPDGRAYGDPAELSKRLVQAAKATGIGLTVLPVLYARGGFDDRPLGQAQRRFSTDPDAIMGILASLESEIAGNERFALGIAPHSLRAVSLPMLREMAASFGARGPIHIHIAEQQAEVDDCLARHGRRPVELLLDELEVDQRWCLVHATHMTPAETERLARSGAVAGLCPTTEANLGDGFFALPDYLNAGGRFGIGSDSNVSVGAAEELRWLEYGQRLVAQQRCMAARADDPRSVGRALFDGALEGGAAAVGRKVGRIAPGYRADFLVLDGDAAGDAILDRMVFVPQAETIRDVMVGGHWVVHERRHALEEAAREKFRRAAAELMEA